jgi:hypothetical protein
MASSDQEKHLHYRLLPYAQSAALLAISPSEFLAVPNARSSKRSTSLPALKHILQEYPDALLIPEERSASETIPDILRRQRKTTPTRLSISPIELSRSKPLSDRVYMSVYSSSSVDTELSEFINPPARRYRVPESHKMPRKISSVSCPIQIAKSGTGS